MASLGTIENIANKHKLVFRCFA